MASSRFESVPESLFFKSPRSDDPRWGDFVSPATDHFLSSAAPGFVMVGHPDDEGIKANMGRAGSQKAPNEIRKAFYRLTPGCENPPDLYDVGNFIISGSLSDRQIREKQEVSKIFQLGHFVFSLGGGHDHAYPDIGGFIESHAQVSPLIINIDAHLDVRPNIPTPNSGSPFYQLLEEYKHIELIEIGIQPFCNSLNHIAYAKKKGVKIFSYKESSGELHHIFQSFADRKRPTFLSIDIDAFSSAFAPGASASYPVGLDPNEFIKLIPFITQHFDLRGVGIYEVSPPLDQDQRTVKLAAILLHSFLLFSKK